MRLDFNVLWVDDQPDRVKAQIDAIVRQMQAEGFLFNPTLCNSIEEVRTLIADNVFTDEIDLILVDWDLGSGATGQDAIATTRQAIPYKDVVFYSAMKPAEELRQLAFDSRLEGIYCASRENLVEEVMGVFESLVKKVLDLDHTRGIVMGATSDIDNMVSQCLVEIHGRCDEKEAAAILAEAVDYVDKRIAKLSESAAKLKQAKTLADFFEEHIILTAYDRLRILAGALKKEALEAHRGYRTSVVAYQQRVVPGRNILGHLVLSPEGKPQAAIDAGGKQMTVEETRELRRLILGLRSDFRNLLLALQGGGR
jgi:hypothetical protein